MRAYLNPELAFTHARTMLGVDVSSLEVSHQLPDTLHEDLSEEFGADDDTPLEQRVRDQDDPDDLAIDVAIEVAVSEFDDEGPKSKH